MASFFAQHSSDWEVRWDVRSGRPHLVQGRGVPLVPGRGNSLTSADVALPRGRALEIADLEPLVRAFLRRFPEMFRLNGSELVLDRGASAIVAGGSDVASIELRQVVNGVPVERAGVFFRLNSGNIVQFGTKRLADVRIDTKPALSREAALARALAAVGAEASTIETLLDAGTLTILPTVAPGDAGGDSYAGAAGEGYRHRLAWELAFRLRDDLRTHAVFVDAHDGEVLAAFDRNAYVEATVTGGIYPRTNTDPEEVRGMPFASVENNGTKVTDAEGVYDYSGGTATVRLDGKHIKIDSLCGNVELTSSTGDLALGTSGGTNCANPPDGGMGNTHAARTSFYHLATVNRRVASILPGNAWLEGKLTVKTDLLDSTCNAHWDGVYVLLYREAGLCTNSGEIASIALHEWGHGLDDSTGGLPPDAASIEASADTTAMLQMREGCIGPNFIPSLPCHNCVDCTGVRDPSDFDIDGPGVIARALDARSDQGIDCDRWACPDNALYGPLRFQGHCESQIASSANWDLAQTMVARYGEKSGWERTELLWYGSAGPRDDAYRNTGVVCGTSTDGCLADNWYTAYLGVNDDNGNLSDGTPDACRIWDAMSAHQIACGSRPPCTVGATCGSQVCPLTTCTAPRPPASECPIDTLVFSAKHALGWTAPGPACLKPKLYDTAKGDLDCLRRSCRPLAQTVPTCVPFENDSSDVTATDAAIPAPGDGFWYLVRIQGGTWNSTGLEQCTDYDVTLPLGCP
jgi:hypothetical protein